jgi:hypothetical protein
MTKPTCVARLLRPRSTILIGDGSNRNAWRSPSTRRPGFAVQYPFASAILPAFIDKSTESASSLFSIDLRPILFQKFAAACRRPAAILLFFLIGSQPASQCR